MMVFIFWSKRFSITVSMNLQWVLEKLWGDNGTKRLLFGIMVVEFHRKVTLSKWILEENMIQKLSRNQLV
jgi:hypothetical protein